MPRQALGWIARVVAAEISGAAQCGNFFQGGGSFGPITDLAPKPLHGPNAPP
jgi:hypothetical protein